MANAGRKPKYEFHTLLVGESIFQVADVDVSGGTNLNSMINCVYGAMRRAGGRKRFSIKRESDGILVTRLPDRIIL